MIGNWTNLIVSGIILAGYAIFRWKIWPIIRENEIARKALLIVHEMEEVFGAGKGKEKFDKACELLQAWLDLRGWGLNIYVVADIVTAAVGVLHAEQGEKPKVKEPVAEGEGA